MTAVVSSLSLKRDLLTGTEWSPAQLRDFFRLATEVKAHPDRFRSSLANSMFVMIFEKPSLRTRVTFETGIASMGGSSTFLDHTTAKLSEREPVRDIAKNLERWVQGIVARVFAQSWPQTQTFPSSTRSPTNSILARRSPISSRSRSASAVCGASSSLTSAMETICAIRFSPSAPAPERTSA
jgi:ornithine carbamoyltransferase